MASSTVINVPTRALLADETKGYFVRWLTNLNIKRNLTSMFINKYLPYIQSALSEVSLSALKQLIKYACTLMYTEINYSNQVEPLVGKNSLIL